LTIFLTSGKWFRDHPQLEASGENVSPVGCLSNRFVSARNLSGSYGHTPDHSHTIPITRFVLSRSRFGFRYVPERTSKIAAWRMESFRYFPNTAGLRVSFPRFRFLYSLLFSFSKSLFLDSRLHGNDNDSVFKMHQLNRHSKITLITPPPFCNLPPFSALH